MLEDAPKGWKALQRKAQREGDPQKLAGIIDQLNRLLDEHERMAASRDSQSRIKPVRFAPSQERSLLDR